MYLVNQIVILVSALIGLAGFTLLFLISYERYQFNRQQIKTREQLVIAEIKRRKQLNVQSLQYSNEYDQELNTLLKVLEEKHGKHSTRG